MNFDPEEWLKVADVCCGTIPGINRDALLRTALNRAYYAALMVLKVKIDAAQGLGSVPSHGTHEALRQAVDTAGAEFTDIARALTKLRRGRELADYVPGGSPIAYERARNAIKTARWLIRNRLKPMPDSEVRRLRVPRG
ncbi:MAG: hypothetical protein JO306_15665 [Gemmatimonadetes bacterium]|nr:hypothetical protein [Gemmatimonadota bacterium]